MSFLSIIKKWGMKCFAKTLPESIITQICRVCFRYSNNSFPNLELSQFAATIFLWSIALL